MGTLGIDEVTDTPIAAHVEACRRHVQLGVRISVSGTKYLIDEIDRLRGMVREFIRLASSDAVADQDWEVQITEAKRLLGDSNK